MNQQLEKLYKEESELSLYIDFYTKKVNSWRLDWNIRDYLFQVKMAALTWKSAHEWYIELKEYQSKNKDDVMFHTNFSDDTLRRIANAVNQKSRAKSKIKFNSARYKKLIALRTKLKVIGEYKHEY